MGCQHPSFIHHKKTVTWGLQFSDWQAKERLVGSSSFLWKFCTSPSCHGRDENKKKGYFHISELCCWSALIVKLLCFESVKRSVFLNLGCWSFFCSGVVHAKCNTCCSCMSSSWCPKRVMFCTVQKWEFCWIVFLLCWNKESHPQMIGQAVQVSIPIPCLSLSVWSVPSDALCINSWIEV